MKDLIKYESAITTDSSVIPYIMPGPKVAASAGNAVIELMDDIRGVNSNSDRTFTITNGFGVQGYVYITFIYTKTED